jgi:hypothetical protein
MKFSEIRQDQWQDLRPYLDTCILPLTGLKGDEPPWKAADLLGRLGELLDLLETPFTGRIVTYPAVHYYTPQGGYAEAVNQICRSLKLAGFKYIILVSADPAVAVMQFADADLFITDDHRDAGRYNIHHLIRGLWQGQLERM